MTENIVTGKKYRVLVDEKNDIWDRVSLWTSSTDVECGDGETAERKLLKLQGICLTDTLTAGNTSITFEDDAITDDCIIDFYTSIYGVNPKSIDNSTFGKLTLTFKAQENDMEVRIIIKEK